MAVSKTADRAYTFSDGDLIQKADFMASCVVRDTAEFATRNAADTAALMAARAIFAECPADSAYAGGVMEATSKKELAFATLKEEISTLRGMAEQAFKGRPGMYKSFGFARFSALGDNDAYRAARLMAKLAELQMTPLSAHGFNATLLSSLASRVSAFEEALDAQKLAEAIRMQQSEERVLLGNALYEEVVRLASIGQSLFANTDEARYNDYVLYPAAG